jgi:ubiquinol-cytochrome c reductase cytochrome b subunit
MGLGLRLLTSWRAVTRNGWLGTPWTGLTALLALALAALLFLSGAAMALYYSPMPGAAWDSVDYAQFKLPFGDIVRGVHVYAANLLLIVLVVHLALIFLIGAYKAPGQRAWISLVLVLLLVPAFFVTGELLPWNQAGYWSTRVRLGIIASVPVVGELIASVVRGGAHIGTVTLSRFFVFHILFLPCALLVLLAAHGYIVGRDVIANPSTGSGRDGHLVLLELANRWLGVGLVAMLGLGLAAWQVPVGVGDPADPTDTTYVPRPEWWALALNQIVTLLSGPWTVVGTVLIPGLLVGIVLALPFIERSPERKLAGRRPSMLVAAGIAATLLLLSTFGYVTHYLAKPAESHTAGTKPRT